MLGSVKLFEYNREKLGIMETELFFISSQQNGDSLEGLLQRREIIQ